MANDTVWTRHKISGVVDKNTPRHIAEHPILGKNLDIVPEGTKPFVPVLHKVEAPNEAKAEKPQAETRKKD